MIIYDKKEALEEALEDGSALEYVSDELLNDKEIVMTVVRQLEPSSEEKGTKVKEHERN